MVMAGATAGASESEDQKSEPERAHERMECLSIAADRRPSRRLRQPDRSGFIGADSWMVGKYES